MFAAAASASSLFFSAPLQLHALPSDSSSALARTRSSCDGVRPDQSRGRARPGKGKAKRRKRNRAEQSRARGKAKQGRAGQHDSKQECPGWLAVVTVLSLARSSLALTRREIRAQRDRRDLDGVLECVSEA